MSDKWQPPRKSATLLSLTRTMRKRAVRKRRKEKRMSKVADRISSFALIGLHRRKWFRALLSQFTPGPDLHQVQTSPAPESWPLPPIAPRCFWRHLYFHDRNWSQNNCQVFSGAATFPQALCEALGLLGGFGCGAVSGLTHKYRPAPPPLQTLTPHCTLYLVRSRREAPDCSSCYK